MPQRPSHPSRRDVTAPRPHRDIRDDADRAVPGYVANWELTPDGQPERGDVMRDVVRDPPPGSSSPPAASPCSRTAGASVSGRRRRPCEGGVMRDPFWGTLPSTSSCTAKHSLPFRAGGWSRNAAWGTATPQSPTAPACVGERVPVRGPGSRVHSWTSPDGQGRETWRTGQQNLLYLATSRNTRTLEAQAYGTQNPARAT
jgi:hypothetical protein